jgi:hypothetical protein
MTRIKLSSFIPKSLRSPAQSTKKVITEFAEDAGMVYFGYVSQRDDEHHIVRGMTVSNKHHDDHYCIGTYEQYDVVFVERTDTLRNGKKHRWHIMEFDLKSTADIPHAFIGSGRHGHGFHELLDVKYPALQPVAIGAVNSYPQAFTSKFKIYTTPAHALMFERLITPEVAAMLASHFTGLVMEITEQALYVYSEKSHLTKELLDTMLKNGAWLATQLDQNSRQL